MQTIGRHELFGDMRFLKRRFEAAAAVRFPLIQCPLALYGYTSRFRVAAVPGPARVCRRIVLVAQSSGILNITKFIRLPFPAFRAHWSSFDSTVLSLSHSP
jgi:hypothetical protein